MTAFMKWLSYALVAMGGVSVAREVYDAFSVTTGAGKDALPPVPNDSGAVGDIVDNLTKYVSENKGTIVMLIGVLGAAGLAKGVNWRTILSGGTSGVALTSALASLDPGSAEAALAIAENPVEMPGFFDKMARAFGYDTDRTQVAQAKKIKKLMRLLGVSAAGLHYIVTELNTLNDDDFAFYAEVAALN